MDECRGGGAGDRATHWGDDHRIWGKMHAAVDVTPHFGLVSELEQRTALVDSDEERMHKAMPTIYEVLFGCYIQCFFIGAPFGLDLENR